MADKQRERVLLDEFLLDSGLAREGWTIAAAGERPDFTCCGPGTSKAGVEVTEILEPATGRARAGDADLADRIRETIAAFLTNVGARGAAVDGHVDGLPHRRSDADGLAENVLEHLRQHGEALTRDHGVVDASFHFPWGVISRITRLDHLGGIFLLDDRYGVERSATTARTPAEIEAALEAAVVRKVALASSYDRSRPLWLVLRNPYSHLMSVSADMRAEISRVNDHVFERVYFYNRKLSTTVARPPRPVVIQIL